MGANTRVTGFPHQCPYMTHTMGGTACTEPPRLAPTTPDTRALAHTAPTKEPTRIPPLIGTPET
jgi:hypothetical protein